MPDSASVPAPHQARSRKTAERLVDSALKLLRKNTFAELSVAQIAKGADRSIGAFYQRFGSKDDFLDVLLIAYFEEACEWAANLEPEKSAHAMFAKALDRSYEQLLAYRNLWHAALERSAAQPGYWARFDQWRDRAAQLGRAAMERSAGRPLTEEERQRVALARQVFNSVFNNQVINAPGPMRLEDPEFLPVLRRVALQIAALDD